MIKKTSIIIFILLLLINTNVFAGDIPEGIMLGEQKALFIGKITSMNKDTCTIVPSTIMMGSIQQSEIQVKRFDKYYGTNEKPKTGDFIVVVLLDNSNIDDLWVFKSTSDDYKTLKLVSERYDMVVRYEKYINEGKYFEAQKNIEENKKELIDSSTISIGSTEKVKSNKMQNYLTNNQFVIPLILIASGIVFLFIVRLKRR